MPAGTLCHSLVAKLVGAGKYDPAASNSSGVLPVILVTDQDCFYRWSEIKAPRLAMELRQNLFFVGQIQKVVVDFFYGDSFLVMVSLVCCGQRTTLHAGHEGGNKCSLEQQRACTAASQHSSNEIKQQLASQGGGAALLWGRAHSPSHCQAFPATVTEQMGLPKLPFPHNCPVTFTQQKPACLGQERTALPHVIKGKIATD